MRSSFGSCRVCADAAAAAAAAAIVGGGANDVGAAGQKLGGSRVVGLPEVEHILMLIRQEANGEREIERWVMAETH